MIMPTANVLLVDDETPFAETLAKRLAKKGILVATAESGHGALSHLDADPEMQVVILDIQMSGMDGMAALAEIKKRHPRV